jgi:hypothetical protein
MYLQKDSINIAKIWLKCRIVRSCVQSAFVLKYNIFLFHKVILKVFNSKILVLLLPFTYFRLMQFSVRGIFLISKITQGWIFSFFFQNVDLYFLWGRDKLSLNLEMSYSTIYRRFISLWISSMGRKLQRSFFLYQYTSDRKENLEKELQTSL